MTARTATNLLLGQQVALGSLSIPQVMPFQPKIAAYAAPHNCYVEDARLTLQT